VKEHVGGGSQRRAVLLGPPVVLAGPQRLEAGDSTHHEQKKKKKKPNRYLGGGLMTDLPMTHSAPPSRGENGVGTTEGKRNWFGQLFLEPASKNDNDKGKKNQGIERKFWGGATTIVLDEGERAVLSTQFGERD